MPRRPKLPKEGLPADLPRLLREERERRAMTQAEAATSIGISRFQFIKFEAGAAAPARTLTVRAVRSFLRGE